MQIFHCFKFSKALKSLQMVSEKLIVPTGMRPYLLLLFMKNIYVLLFNLSIFFFPNLSYWFTKLGVWKNKSILKPAKYIVWNTSIILTICPFYEGFIKATDHRPTDPQTPYHLLTDPPTHRLAIINLRYNRDQKH